MSPADMTEVVCQALDCMHLNRTPFAARYDLMGPSGRTLGSFGSLHLARIKESGVRIPTRFLSLLNVEDSFLTSVGPVQCLERFKV